MKLLTKEEEYRMDKETQMLLIAVLPAVLIWLVCLIAPLFFHKGKTFYTEITNWSTHLLFIYTGLALVIMSIVSDVERAGGAFMGVLIGGFMVYLGAYAIYLWFCDSHQWRRRIAGAYEEERPSRRREL